MTPKDKELERLEGKHYQSLVTAETLQKAEDLFPPLPHWRHDQLSYEEKAAASVGWSVDDWLQNVAGREGGGLDDIPLNFKVDDWVEKLMDRKQEETSIAATPQDREKARAEIIEKLVLAASDY